MAQDADAARRPAASWEFSTGIDASTGRYGGAADTAVTDLHLAAKVQFDRLRLEASLPVVSLKGPGQIVGGVPVLSAGETVSSRRSGLGDLNLAAAYRLNDAKGYRPILELSAGIKLPTARLGIGTARTDYALAATVYETLSPQVTAFASAGYSWLTDSATYVLENGVTASGGVDYRPGPATSLGLSAAYRQPVARGLEAQLVVSPYLTRRLSTTWGVTLYGMAGLTDASPRLGGGLWISLFR